MAGRPHGPSDPAGFINELRLSGIAMGEPTMDVDRKGDRAAFLQVDFLAPDSPDTVPAPEIASCEVEVPAGQSVAHLVGKPVLILGMLTGGGGVLAKRIGLL